jgi:hypothetical protein
MSGVVGAVTDSPTPLDGAIVRFLLRVIDRFEATVSDPDALLSSLKAVGLDDSAVTQYQSFLAARASDVAKISSDLPKLVCTEKVIRFDSVRNPASVGVDDRADPPVAGSPSYAASVQVGA